MRIKYKVKRPDVYADVGSIRTVERFLWFPKIMGKADTGEYEIRWLCKARWKQVLKICYPEYGDSIIWIDFGPFLD